MLSFDELMLNDAWCVQRQQARYTRRARGGVCCARETFVVSPVQIHHPSGLQGCICALLEYSCNMCTFMFSLEAFAWVPDIIQYLTVSLFVCCSILLASTIQCSLAMSSSMLKSSFLSFLTVCMKISIRFALHFKDNSSPFNKPPGGNM